MGRRDCQLSEAPSLLSVRTCAGIESCDWTGWTHRSDHSVRIVDQTTHGFRSPRLKGSFCQHDFLFCCMLWRRLLHDLHRGAFRQLSFRIRCLFIGRPSCAVQEDKKMPAVFHTCQNCPLPQMTSATAALWSPFFLFPECPQCRAPAFKDARIHREAINRRLLATGGLLLFPEPLLQTGKVQTGG